MQNKHVIGVDLGISGGMSLINDNKQLIACEPIPVFSVMVGKKIRNQYDIPAVIAIIKRWTSEFNVVQIGFERLRAIPNQMSQTAFSMGGSTMLFKTLATVFRIPYIETEPRSWQKRIFGDLGIQYDKKTTKIASIQAAKRLFPEESFLRTERSKKPHDGLCDSANIGAYLVLLDN